MLDRLYGFASGRLILMGLAMAHKLFASRRMLSFGEASKFSGAYGAGQTEFLAKPALPLAGHGLSAAPIALIGRGELACVIGLGLTGG
jgi:hypothetical protein